MSDTVYNEDIREYVIARYDALGNASRHMRALMTAKDHDKFTSTYTTVMRDVIAEYLELHHSADANLPDLDEWAGLNAPQRIYQLAGGHVGDGAQNSSGFWFWDNYVSNVLDNCTISAGQHGSGFERAPTLTLDHVNGTGASVRAVMGWVTGCAITDEGDDYTSAPTVTISAPDDAQGVTATMSVYRGKVATLSITAGGSGYAAGDTVTVGGADDNSSGTATATLTIAAGVVTGITITDAGSGYTNVPGVTFNTSTGTGATGTATIDDSVIAGCYITNQGTGYTTQPTATMSGGGGSGATFSVDFDDSVVGSVYVVAGGSGYDVGVSGYPEMTIVPTPEFALSTSTTAQMADDGYVPSGWSGTKLAPSATVRNVLRSERTGYLGNWSEWSAPFIGQEYTA